MEPTTPDYIRFAKKFGIELKNEKYLEWELTDYSVTEFDDFDFENFDYKNVYDGNFDILDEILLKICPNILPLQYKFLYKKCVGFNVNKYEKNDCYYHPYRYVMVKRCDIEKLYNFLVTNKLFNEGDL